MFRACHARVALGHQLRHTIPVAFGKDRDGAARQVSLELGVRFARRLKAKRLSLFEPVGARADGHHMIASFTDGRDQNNLILRKVAARVEWLRASGHGRSYGLAGFPSRTEGDRLESCRDRQQSQ